jgi:hypothetical protein
MMFAMPLNNNLMSIASFWFATVWVVDIVFEWTQGISPGHRFRRFMANRSALAFTGIYALCLLGFLWSDDLQFAIRDARIKLPFLFLPLVVSSYQKIESKHLIWCFYVYLGTITYAITNCTGVYYRWWGNPYTNVRDISHFISHIRFSLMIVLGLCLLAWFVWKKRSHLIWTIPLALYFVFFLWILQSMTGFVILGVLIGYWSLFAILTSKRRLVRYGVSAILIFGVGAIGLYLNSAYREYFHVKDEVGALPERSLGGEAYLHNLDNKLLENGHYVWIGIAPNELRRSWNQRSSIHIDSLGRTKQVVGATLIRYLSSKGVLKDSVSVYQLTESEITAIEAGQATAYPEQLKGIRGRLNKIFFEYDNYRNGGDPSGNSVMQRFEFWRAAIGIIRENPWLGVGTGDLKSAYAFQYEKMKTALDPSYRLRAHNQYLTYAVTFGILGLVLFILLLLIILFDQKKQLNFLFMSYFLITALSFLTEDTLETQAGVAFVAVWGVVLGGMREWGEESIIV